MSNSPLVDLVRLSPNRTRPRNRPISKITIHHAAAVTSAAALGALFAMPERKASSNYGIGQDGQIGMYVEEANRSWCSSSAENDNMAITIEVSNSEKGGDWPVSDLVMGRLIDLCVDICQRNHIPRLNFTGDAAGSLTMHKYFSNTGCPGPYLSSKFPYIAEEVNKRLGSCVPEEEPDADREPEEEEEEEMPITELPMLRSGSRGTPVKALQLLLNGFGYAAGGVDGIFGARTVSALKAFQRKHGLVPDGICGPLSWGKLLGV